MVDRKEKYLLYIGVCVALLPVLLLRDFTPSNELRYLSIADEALRNHTFFAFTNHGMPYADKPPLYLWIVMLCRWLTGGHHMWLLSLFSLVPALVIVRTMDRWAATELETKMRPVARMMLLTCGLFIGTAATLRMDMLMCMFIVLSLRSFWRMAMEEDSKEKWLFPVYLFLAVFTKGPVGLLVPLCSTAVFLLLAKRIRRFGRYWGWRTWGVLLGGFVPWFACAYAEGGSEYLHNLLFHQTLDRAVNSFHHNKPFYYYALSIWYCLAPWSLLIAGTITAALRSGVVRTDLQRFFLAISISTFVLLSCISTKLQIYLLPAFPFMAYAAAMFLPRFCESRWLRATVMFPAILFAFVLPAVIILALAGMDGMRAGLVYAAACMLTASGVCAFVCVLRERGEIGKPMRILGTGLLLAVFIGGWRLPRFNNQIGYADLCEKALLLSREKNVRAFYCWRVSRAENMDVYLHDTVQIIPKEEELPAGLPCPAILMLRKRDLELFPDKPAYVSGKYAVICLEGQMEAIPQTVNP